MNPAPPPVSSELLIAGGIALVTLAALVWFVRARRQRSGTGGSAAFARISSESARVVAGDSDLQLHGVEALIALDREGCIASASAQAQEILGRDVSALRGLAWEALAPRWFRDHAQAFSVRARAGETIDNEDAQWISELGQVIEILVSARTAATGEVVVSVRDVRMRQRADDMLRLLRHALDVSPDAVALIDASGGYKVRWANAAASQLTGQPLDQLLEQPLPFMGATASAEVEVLRSALSRGRPARAVVRDRRADGSAFPNAVAISPLRDASDGVVKHFAVTMRDLDCETRELEKWAGGDSVLRRIVETLPTAVVALDPKGFIETANPAFASLLNTRTEDLIGTQFTIWCGDSEFEIDIFEGGALELRCADGTPRSVDARVVRRGMANSGPPELLFLTQSAVPAGV